MRLERDPEADAVYIYLRRKKYAYGVDIDVQRRVDYSADGTPIGVELLNVSTGVNLSGLPRALELGGLLDAEGVGACTIDLGWEALSEETTRYLVNCVDRYFVSASSPIRVLGHRGRQLSCSSTR
jgi:uncharacterized protein YuzE